MYRAIGSSGIGVLALAVSACGGNAGADATPGEPQPSSQGPSGSPGDAGGWEQLPAPPLSGRTGALVAAVGDTIVVAGGWSFLCPPGADCTFPEVPPFADGAAYDVDSGEWRRIADAPVGFTGVASAVAGADLYALSQCELGPLCPAGRSLLRYRSGADEWDVLPGPEAGEVLTGFGLIAVDDGVVAFSLSDEYESKADHRFVASEGRWEALPNDPLPEVYDRFLVEYGGRLMLFGSPRGSGNRQTKLAAAYEPGSGAWEERAASGTMGYQVWRAGERLYLNPHFRGGGGGVYDPALDRWSPFPAGPHHDMAGLIGADEAHYAYASGWVLDTRSGGWREIDERPDTREVYDYQVAPGPDLALVVFGGQTWQSGEGELVNDIWRWRPPASAPSQ